MDINMIKQFLSTIFLVLGSGCLMHQPISPPISDAGVIPAKVTFEHHPRRKIAAQRGSKILLAGDSLAVEIGRAHV